MTAIKTAMRKAGYQTGDARIADMAFAMLRKNRVVPESVVHDFLLEVRKDDELLFALLTHRLTESYLRSKALAYLTERAEDMNGTAVKAAADGGGQTNSDVPYKDVPATSPEIGGDAEADGVGQRPRDSQAKVAHPSAPLRSQMPLKKTAGGGQLVRDIQGVTASPSPTPAWSPSDLKSATRAKDTKVFVNDHWREPPGKVAAKATKPRVPLDQQLAAHNTYALIILDTLKIRGKAIGDWTHEEMMAQAETSAWEARILEAFGRRTPAGGRVRDYVTPEEAESILKTAEASNAA